ncbi:MAG: phenylalanine--tRNA ligase subunit beta [Nitrosomonadales bacterium]|nr:phenylalanine--tRNA ligase subunit beta [Nitrosomonadales bacterium]
MKFSENWLRSWANPALDTDGLGHQLTMAGLEVEAQEAAAPTFNNVVVAEVLEVVKHPNADRLNVCQVNVGEAAPITIVCGASNVAVGVKVPCARIGAVLPGDFKIKQAKVRNVESFGMLCSAKELGLAEESQGLWLLPADAPVGTTIRAYLDLDDTLYTLKLTPNRSDCLGIAGLAREVAAITGCAITPVVAAPVADSVPDTLPVTVSAAACGLYCGRVVRGVNAAAATPDWMVRRLERSGIRSISAVVDITNYVLLELGQPMHAFDLARLSGGITVRPAAAGEKLELLNGQTVELNPDYLLIADDARALALAGIMGGAGSGVETTTTDVFLEAAWFDPNAIAGKARSFGLNTDSSFRFERGVDFVATRAAMERATQLLLDICGGAVGPISEVRGELPQRAPILLRTSRVKRVLGIDLSVQQIEGILDRLRFRFALQGADFLVTPPSYRFDLGIEADLIEELARIHGYDNIPALPPQGQLSMLPVSESLRPLRRLRQLLVSRDYQETVSYAFLEADVERDLCGNSAPVTLQNPIASQFSVMRSSLLGGLVGALRVNLSRRQPRVRLFESGACFAAVDGSYTQTERLAGLCYGSIQPEQWGAAARSVDFYDAKGDVEALFAPRSLCFVAATHPASHPGRSAQIFLGEQAIGWIGEIHPQWQQQYDLPQAAVWFEVELAALLSGSVTRASDVSRFPPVRRDLAVVVDESVALDSLLDELRAVRTEYVVGVELFDVYRGKGLENGKKSLAFRVLLQDTQKTLTDAEIERDVGQLLVALQSCGAQLRG